MSAAKSIPEGFDFWAVAGDHFMRDAPPRDAVDWCFGDVAAVHSLGDLARVLADMGLVRRLAVLPRRRSRLWYENRLRSLDLSLHVAKFPVFLMATEDDATRVWVCSVTGNWITNSGGAKGEGITGLHAFMAGTGAGKAAQRIARICGYRRLPYVRELGR
jgi:hypothetical protein